jgi:hypothetical protein
MRNDLSASMLLVSTMRTRLGSAAAGMRAVVRGFLARGWPARLAACALVSLAAVVWLGALVAVLRAAAVLALSAAMVGCVWLVLAVWRQRPLDVEGRLGSLARLVWARLGSPSLRRVGGRDEPAEQDGMAGFEAQFTQREAVLSAVRSSVDALSAELLGRQERLDREARQLQRELTSQLEALGALIARVEHEVSRLTENPDRAAPPTLRTPDRAAPVVPAPDPRDVPEPELDAFADLDFDAAVSQLEADLRLEKLDEREQLLDELEESLSRRERELAALVAQTQAMLG